MPRFASRWHVASIASASATFLFLVWHRAKSARPSAVALGTSAVVEPDVPKIVTVGSEETNGHAAPPTIDDRDSPLEDRMTVSAPTLVPATREGRRISLALQGG